ncbi:MAG TPA: polysaccharide deacetylase family protein, partial [Candidatus Omnitrophota bacterium]|nr:polysaccharide deacetylase family protein [Candidatus Omnitrophota bacterium]
MAPNRSGQIKQAVKHSVSGFVGSGWSFRSLRAFNRERLLILCYHRVIHESDAGRVNISDMFSDLDSFTVQMDFISRHYAPVSEQDIIDALAGRRKLPDFSAWVTFDDGYRDNFTLAYPILKKFSIPATFFISPGLIDRDAAAMVELRKTVGIGPEEATDYFMNWEQIRELSAQGYSIGSHTCTHRILSTL